MQVRCAKKFRSISVKSNKRCRHCGEPLARRTGECLTDWNDRLSCGRSCHTAWKNSKPIWQTFSEMSEVKPSGCIEWNGYKDPKGYGRFSSHSGEVLAHRLAFLMHYGNIPNSMHVLHRCDNPPCINPQHLFLGTNQDNMDDMVRKGRSVIRFGKDNPNWRHGLNCSDK